MSVSIERTPLAAAARTHDTDAWPGRAGRR